MGKKAPFNLHDQSNHLQGQIKERERFITNTRVLMCGMGKLQILPFARLVYAIFQYSQTWIKILIFVGIFRQECSVQTTPIKVLLM